MCRSKRPQRSLFNATALMPDEKWRRLDSTWANSGPVFRRLISPTSSIGNRLGRTLGSCEDPQSDVSSPPACLTGQGRIPMEAWMY